MTDILESALILLVLLQVKHMFADFFLQTPRMLSGRGQYVQLGRAQHAFVHSVGSAIALVAVGTAQPLMVYIIVAEWLAHYHIDWGKGRYSDITQNTPTDAGFWRAVGFDQALHQLTYVAMIWGWASYHFG